MRDVAAIRGTNDTSPSCQVDPLCVLSPICTRISPNIGEEHVKHDIFFFLRVLGQKTEKKKLGFFLKNLRGYGTNLWWIAIS
jgi:hypothetical protein